jgi:hypothetical protein
VPHVSTPFPVSICYYPKGIRPVGIIEHDQDTTSFGPSSRSSDPDSSTLISGEDRFGDVSGYQGDVEDYSSDEELSSLSEGSFDDTFDDASDYEADIEDWSVAEVLSAFGGESSDDYDYSDYGDDAEQQSAAEIPSSLGNGGFDDALDGIEDQFTAEEDGPLAKALIPKDWTKLSTPALFVMRRYPSLFLSTANPLPSDDNVSEYYQGYNSEDFKRLAEEEPQKFLRIAIPYLDISNGLSDPFTLFMEWNRDYEARNPHNLPVKQDLENEKDFEVRQRMAWVNAEQWTARGRGDDWTKVSDLINREFCQRYPLSKLLSDEMQSIIRDTLRSLREGEDPNLKSGRQYWLKVYEQNFPQDLKRRGI